MGTNKNLFIFLGLAVVALVATLMSGGFKVAEEPDFAQQLAEQRGGTIPTAPAADPTPAQTNTATATPPAETPPLMGDGGAESGSPADAMVQNPCAEDTLGSEPGAAPAEVGDDPVATEDLGGNNAGAIGGDSALEGVLGDDALATAGTEEGVLDDEDLFLDDEDLFLDDELSDDPIERFKDMDPRDIIDAKYKDLESRLTTPWDEEDPDNHIFDTGRPDPLTRIRDAIPELLMPPRDGPTDESNIQLYAASLQATLIVDGISFSLQCYNVLQIGLTKYASFGTRDGMQQFTMGEGQGRQFPFYVEGVSGTVTMIVTSITTELVTVNYSAQADAVDLGVSKTQHFIPAKRF